MHSRTGAIGVPQSVAPHPHARVAFSIHTYEIDPMFERFVGRLTCNICTSKLGRHYIVSRTSLLSNRCQCKVIKQSSQVIQRRCVYTSSLCSSGSLRSFPPHETYGLFRSEYEESDRASSEETKPAKPLPLSVEEKEKEDWNCAPVVTTLSGVIHDVDDKSYYIGVYWGKNDSSNHLKRLRDEVVDQSGAEIEACCLALKQAIYNLHLPRVIVKIRSQYIIRCVEKFLSRWMAFGWVTSNGKPVRNAKELQELGRCLEFIDAKFIVDENSDLKRSALLNSLLKEQNVISNPDYENLKRLARSAPMGGSLAVTSASSSVPTVSVFGVFHSETSRGTAFPRAGYGVYWENEACPSVSGRLSMFPATLFRAQLHAIQVALEQAVSAGYDTVVIRTDALHFLKHFRNGWRKSDGSAVKNYPQYKNIVNLCSKIKARFIATAENDQLLLSAKDLAESGLTQPLVGNQKWRRRAEEILSWKVVTDSPLDDGIQSSRVCVVSMRDNGRMKCAVYWEKDPIRLSCCHCLDDSKSTTVAKALNFAVQNALKQAIKSGDSFLTVRTNSKRLLKTVIEWMPSWKLNNWTNSLKKPIKHAEMWKELESLMQKVKVKWEYAHESEQNEELRSLDKKAFEFIQSAAKDGAESPKNL
ncbi:hypothetical protein AB6A40_001636 [Gnathostoma spinigerum]|uniref:ribonuclease H n=1 Tax=Gnathostoma spinigerum TaxID=75299 RepID=A0ABD6EE08_9BILA